MSQPHTPYSPPLARVSDPEEPEIPKPPAIGRAARCLWISAAVVVVTSGLALAGVSGPRDAVVPLIAISLFSIGLLALVAWQLNAGRGWVRWLFLVLFVLGSGMFALGLVLTPQAYLAMPRLDMAAALLQFGLQTAALILMFTPAAARWLKSARRGQ